MDKSGSVSLISLELKFPGCKSLKEKRSILQPLLLRLRKEFNVSAAEIGHLDSRDEAWVGCVIVSNDGRYNQQVLSQLLNYVSEHFVNIEVADNFIESR